MKETIDPASFTIGWISALAVEYEAACLSLDEDLGRPNFLDSRDDNVYTIGRIGPHHVVLAFLPKGTTGTNAAAVVARDLVRSFPNIRLGLMVGIGGGAPKYPERDIRLGDVVVSVPSNGNSGVIQYDFGKVIQGHDQYRRTAHLDQPPAALRAAVTQLQRVYNREKHQIRPDIDRRLASVRPRLRRALGPRSPNEDRLFRSDYVHGNDSEARGGCTACSEEDPSALITRRERNAHVDDDDDDPTIHYGLIASGNTLIKDAKYRDWFSAKEGVLCFEMEAAGLMNHFPCIVIRGICDYADSHKNKDWQGYASMTAAAYTTDLVKQLVPRDVDRMSSVHESLSNLQNSILKVEESTTLAAEAIDELLFLKEQDGILAWLSAPKSASEFAGASDRRQQGTCQWIFQDSAYQRWLSRSNGILLLNGESGCGKTVMASYLVEHLQQHDAACITLFFFFTINDPRKRTLNGLLSSLIAQLLRLRPSSCGVLLEQYRSLGGQRRPSTPDLISVFTQMVARSHNISLILDAIDECSERDAVLAALKTILEVGGLKVKALVTGRPRKEIESEILMWNTYGQVASLDVSAIDHDIRVFVKSKARQDSSAFRGRWANDLSVTALIEERILGKANGSFRWAALQMQSIMDCMNLENLKMTLDSLPNTIADTYSKALHRIPSGYRPQVITLLQLLTGCKRPLSIWEAYDAMAMNDTGSATFLEKRFTRSEDIFLLCPELVTLESSTDHPVYSRKEIVVFAHASVYDYLVSDAATEYLSDALKPESRHLSILRTSLKTISFCAEEPLLEWMRRAKPHYMKNDLLSLHQYIQLKPYDENDERAPVSFTYKDVARGRSKFCSYATEHWFAHTEPINSNEECIRLLADFAEDEAASRFLALSHSLIELPFVHDLCLRKQNRVLMALSQAAIEKFSPIWGNPLEFAMAVCDTSVVKTLQLRGASQRVEGSLGSVSGMLGWLLGQNLWTKTSIHGEDLDVLNHVPIAHERMVDPSVQMIDVAGPLRLAVRAKSRDTLMRLLSEYFNPEFTSLLFEMHPIMSELGFGSVLDDFLADVFTNELVPSDYPGLGLHCAALAGDNAKVLAYLHNGTDLNAWGTRYRTALQAAAAHNRASTISLLMSHGANPSVLGGKYGSALQAATSCAHVEAVQTLLQFRIDIDLRPFHDELYKSDYYATPLQLAVKHRHEEILLALMIAEADVNATWERQGPINPRFPHTKSEHLEHIRQPILPDNEQIFGSALQIAAHAGNEWFVELLLENGADVDLCTGKYGTALQAAAAAGRTNIVRRLLRAGAVTEGGGTKFASPLHAAVYNRRLDTVKTLLAWGAVVNAPIGRGMTVVDVAFRLGNLNIAEALLAKGARPLEARVKGAGGEEVLYTGHLDGA